MKKSILQNFEFNNGDNLIEPQHSIVKSTLEKFENILSLRNEDEENSIISVVTNSFNVLELTIVKLHIMTLENKITNMKRGDDIVELMIELPGLDESSLIELFGDDFLNKLDQFLNENLNLDYAVRKIRAGIKMSMFFFDYSHGDYSRGIVKSYLNKEDEVSMWRLMPEYMTQNYSRYSVGEQLEKPMSYDDFVKQTGLGLLSNVLVKK